MTVNWMKLCPSGPFACYGIDHIKEMQVDDLREVILRLSGRLAPEDCQRDKLWEWAAYLFEAARYASDGRIPPERFAAHYRTATNPEMPATDDYWKRRSDRAKEAFAKMAAKGPSPSSAMGTAFKMLDDGGEMPAMDLMKALRKAGKDCGLNSARSYLSCWRRKKKEEGKNDAADAVGAPVGAEAEGESDGE